MKTLEDILRELEKMEIEVDEILITDVAFDSIFLKCSCLSIQQKRG
ncbi:hypothetical protein ACFLWS_08085 [Chloroflexota bacterium]